MTTILRRAALAVPAAALLAGLAAAPASAAPQTVIGGQLDWTQINVYVPTAESAGNTLNRTYLGFFTQSANPGAQLGTVSPAGAAWGDTVTPQSPRGPLAASTWTYPVVGGSYDAAARTGTVKVLGSVRFVSPAAVTPNFGFDYTVTIDDPLIRLNGSTAEVFASGQTAVNVGSPSQAQTTYDAGTKLFDLSGATQTSSGDGLAIGPMAPTLLRSDVFPQVAAPTGPERTPNRFGSFDLRIVTPTTGPKGDAGAGGKDGVSGKDGTSGKDGESAVVAHLRSAPYAGAKTRRVVLQRAGAVVGSGTLRRTTLKLALRKGATVGEGSYQLRLWGGKTLKSVRIG